jgi:hypothetical protein
MGRVAVRGQEVIDIRNSLFYLCVAIAALVLFVLWWHLPPDECNKDGLSLQGCYYASRVGH